MSSVEHQFAYAFKSELIEKDSVSQLRLCSTISEKQSGFFEGKFVQPMETALCLRQMALLVGSRFYTPPSMLARILRESDPVITVSRQMLRFEGFSACCGVYGRIDVLPSGLNIKRVSPGTTNVDFNSDIRNLLARFRGTDSFGLTVSSEGIEASQGNTKVFEKKVKLPLRWLKGFAEVQSIQSQLQPAMSLSKFEAVKLLRNLPKGKSKHRIWLVKSGNGIRISHRPFTNSISIKGSERLEVLSELAESCNGIDIFISKDYSVSAWVVSLNHIRFTFIFSAEVWRGFSGEGNLLNKLIITPKSLGFVKSQLKWQDHLTSEHDSFIKDFDKNDIELSLAHLANQGLVGYDLINKSYFHRELPFCFDSLQELNPRLKSALEIVQSEKVKLTSISKESVTSEVQSGDVTQLVEINESGDKCTCPWYSKHQLSRGSCKHILATRILMEENEKVS